MTTHIFDSDDAERYGVNAAILLQNLRFWIAKNEASGDHSHDGRTWTYNSIKSWETLFPYFTANQIRTALDKLVEAGAIIKGNYNPNSYDRTCWYAIASGNPVVSKPYSICEKTQMETSANTNHCTDVNTDVTTDSKPLVQPSLDADFEAFYHAYPRHEAKEAARKAWKRLKEPDKAKALEGLPAYCAKVSGRERQYIALPASWLNGRRWEDDSSTDPARTNQPMTRDQARHVAATTNLSDFFNDDGTPKPAWGTHGQQQQNTAKLLGGSDFQQNAGDVWNSLGGPMEDW